jgi:predicted O-methyltransferase YrrM
VLNPTRDDYSRVFESECLNETLNLYSAIDAFEKDCGFSIDRGLLRSMARVLNCPIKRNPPNWQHGRVIYAALMNRMRRLREDWKVRHTCAYLDIGTAKGFSAVVMAHALIHWHQQVRVYTADVVDPSDRVARNTVAELDGLKTVWELTEPFMPSTAELAWIGDSYDTLDVLSSSYDRIPFAFVDGKHDSDHVMKESAAIAAMQYPGDVIVFDDCQMIEVGRAVSKLRGYEQRVIDIKVRKYVVATKRSV